MSKYIYFPSLPQVRSTFFNQIRLLQLIPPPPTTFISFTNLHLQVYIPPSWPPIYLPSSTSSSFFHLLQLLQPLPPPSISSSPPSTFVLRLRLRPPHRASASILPTSPLTRPPSWPPTRSILFNLFQLLRPLTSSKRFYSPQFPPQLIHLRPELFWSCLQLTVHSCIFAHPPAAASLGIYCRKKHSPASSSHYRQCGHFEVSDLQIYSRQRGTSRIRRRLRSEFPSVSFTV
jgi:hypothetical protein